jgi:hypothetical protein
VTSNIMNWVSLLYGEPGIFSTENDHLTKDMQMTVSITAAIAKLRLDPATLARKSSLYLRPLSASSDGYLAGYLAVKSFHRSIARSSHKALNEADLFLLFMISYFYSDHGLVHAILNDQLKPLERVQAIVARLADRIDRTMTVTYDDMRIFEDEVDTGSPNYADHGTQGIGVSDAEYRAGKSMLDGLYNDLFRRDPPDHFGGRSFQTMADQLLARRYYLSFGMLRGITRISEDGIARFEVDGDVIYEAPCLKGVTPGDGAGSIEIVAALSRADGLRATVICRDRQVVAEHMPGPEDLCGPALDRLHRMYSDRQIIQHNEQIYAEAIDKVFAKPAMTLAVEHAKELFLPRIDALYKDVAMRFARDYEALDACSALMETGGFRPLLKKTALIQGAALMGLVTSYVPNRHFVEAVFRERGLSLDETLADLETCFDTHGYPPRVMDAEGAIYSTI